MAETDKPPPKIAKKLWNLVYYIMRKGISKSKLMLDLDFLTKHGKIASKAIENLMIQHHHHYSTLSCRSDDVLSSFISPREYEFSCSNSPAYPYRHRHRHRHVHPRLKNQHHHHPKYDQRFHEETDVLQQPFDVLNLRDQYPVMVLPGLGNSPLVNVRQLRVTDSPFSVNDHTEENHQVDSDAEKFIKRFYKELRNQRRIAAFESPPSYHM